MPKFIVTATEQHHKEAPRPKVEAIGKADAIQKARKIVRKVRTITDGAVLYEAELSKL